MRKARRVFLLLSVAALALCSCRKRAPPATLAASRVVSLSPSTTEAMWAIGAAGMLVGRSAQCDFPAEVLALPVVGDLTAPNLERVLMLKPTSVVGDAAVDAAGVGRRLADLGVQSYFPRSESVSDVFEMLIGLGQRFGHAREAEAVAARIAAELESLRKEAVTTPHPRVLLVLQTSPVFVVGPRAYLGELLRLVGGENVMVEGSYPQLGAEPLATLKPDLVVLLHGDREPAPSIDPRAAGWAQMPAVQKHAVCTVRSSALMRPGPRVAEGARALRECIASETRSAR